MFYIYGLAEHGSDEVRYVGMTPRLKKRMEEHCRDFRSLSRRKNLWLLDLLLSGRFPEMVILERSEKRNFQLEREWIDKLRAAGHRLTNMEEDIRNNLIKAASNPKSEFHKGRIAAALRGIPRLHCRKPQT